MQGDEKDHRHQGGAGDHRFKGLKEAKEFTEKPGPNQKIKEAVSKLEAEALKKRLEDAGAVITLSDLAGSNPYWTPAVRVFSPPSSSQPICSSTNSFEFKLNRFISALASVLQSLAIQGEAALWPGDLGELGARLAQHLFAPRNRIVTQPGSRIRIDEDHVFWSGVPHMQTDLFGRAKATFQRQQFGCEDSK